MSEERGAQRPLRLGISACLLGAAVRYDGGHKRDAFLAELLGRFVEWVPVCPELEAGLGVPRPALRLVRSGATQRLLEVDSGRDHTSRMQRYARRRVRELRGLELCGYVLKKSSPSCGMTRVKLYAQGPGGGGPSREGIGLYAGALLEAYPSLPVEEEGRLADAGLRENFIERVFAYRRLRDLFRPGWTLGELVAFHSAHELQLLAHSPQGYREIGRLVASAKRWTRAALRDRYEADFMAALARLASRGRNANVLQHAAGYLRGRLQAAARGELAALIHDYRRGWTPLVVPVTRIRHHVRGLDLEYLCGQTFLEPHPRELMLRNHVGRRGRP